MEEKRQIERDPEVNHSHVTMTRASTGHVSNLPHPDSILPHPPNVSRNGLLCSKEVNPLDLESSQE